MMVYINKLFIEHFGNPSLGYTVSIFYSYLTSLFSQALCRARACCHFQFLVYWGDQFMWQLAAISALVVQTYLCMVME